MDVVELVKENKGNFEYYEIVSVHNKHKLYIKVFRDAMKFDCIPAMKWNLKPIANDSRTFSGVRLPATAYQLQQIADLLGCMLLTPKVIDLIWLQATLKFDAIVNINNKIVAISNIHDVHQAIQKKVKLKDIHKKHLISCVGKYWCLINDLNTKGKVFSSWVACNYGWFAKRASGPGITRGTSCWQRPGFRHNSQHSDPSQTIRLMHRSAVLVYPDKSKKVVDLHDIAKDPDLAQLIHHQGVLTYLRQMGPEELQKMPYQLVTVVNKNINSLF